jgi:predicted RNase H-like HicB family nuclease
VLSAANPAIIGTTATFTVIKVNMSKRLTAVIHREEDMYVALCPELDVVSQGETVELARDNLREAVELFLECASDAEVQDRLGEDMYVTQFEVTIG